MKMDKQQEAQNAGDSISSVDVPVNVKGYTPSEVFTEPLPAYKKNRATAIQIARIAAFTVIVCTIILGLCLIAASWIEATASCSQLFHAEALIHQQQNDEAADRPSYQALMDPLQSDESSESKQETIAAPPPPHPSLQHEKEIPMQQNSVPSQSSFDQSSPIQIKLPLQLDFDDFAGSLMDGNQRSRMNCVVEKKRAEEVMDHQPKTVRLPFGVNVTTDPRYEHVTGERMAIYCESGRDQRHLPIDSRQQQQQQQPPVIVPMSMTIPMMHNQMLPPPQLQQQEQPQQQINQIPMSMITRAAQEQNIQLQKQSIEEGPITVITREEHIIPLFQQVVPEMPPLPSNSIEGRALHFHPAGPEARMMSEERMLHTLAIPGNRHMSMAEGRSMSHPAGPVPAVPSDIVRPPPPPTFHRIPIHVPTILQQVENQQVNENVLDEEAEGGEMRPHYVQPRSVRSVDAVLHPREKRVRRSYACQCTC